MTSGNHLLDLIQDVDGSGLQMPGGAGGHSPRYLEFPLLEYARRYARAQVLMDEIGIDALVLAQPTTVRYFTGLQTWLWILPPVIPIVAILTREPSQATLVDAEMERGGVEETTWIADPILYGGADDPIDAVADAIRQRGLDTGRLGFELGTGQRPNLSPADLQRLISSLPHAQIVDAADLLAHLRMLKSDQEICRLREATRLSQIGFRAALEAMQPGISEVELTRVAERAMLDAGARPSAIAMTLIFLTGPERYRQVVQPAVERAVREGEMVWLDGGCSVDGYRADFIRAGVVGRLPRDGERYYALAVEALEAAVASMGPDRPLGDAWSAAQSVFDEAGVGTATLIPDQIGHGVGLDHWEMPLIGRPGTAFDDLRARPGMILCVEPTLVGPDGDPEWRQGIFVAEDQIAITSSGVEVLTADLPRTLYHG